jgi:signal peptidase I
MFRKNRKLKQIIKDDMEDTVEEKNVKDEEITEEDIKESVKSSHEYGLFSRIGSFFLEIIKIAILAGITIGVVRYFLFKPFYVQGQSMEPNFHEKDYLIIDEISYRLHDPKRGDVVVFKAPVNADDYYLKRVIGLPGEKIKIEKNKIIIFNKENPQGFVLQEEYLDASTTGDVDVTLGDEQYYVLGDNRIASFDSRRFGPINEDTIVGRAWLRGWPFDRLAIFETPNFQK